MLLYRNVRERVAARGAVSTLRQPIRTWSCARTARLVWICDGYTASDRYPYAQRLPDGGLNYIRNSVKAVVDAYDGTIELYVADARDPIAAHAGAASFGHSFVPLAQMPADIRAHLRYPERIFDIQTQLFSTYHMREPELLYNREDQWEIPALSGGTRRRAHAAVLHGDEVARREQRRVHLDAAVHAEAQGQPGGVDGRALGRRAPRASWSRIASRKTGWCSARSRS